jgi:succinoglycan biosynthesis protein ExoV
MKVALYRWASRRFGENLGDWTTIPLLQAFGVDVDVYGPGEKLNAALFGTGSILHYPHYDCAPRIAVWGSGVGCMAPAPEHVKVFALRGPISADALRCFGVPLGDPALLAPHLLGAITSNVHDVVHVKHIWQDETFEHRTLESTSPSIGSLTTIANAKFVLSSTLHGAILAHAYHVPWAPFHVYEPLNVKWQDWFAYLGLPGYVPKLTTHAECIVWWESWGRHGKRHSVLPLMGAAQKAIEHVAIRQDHP